MMEPETAVCSVSEVVADAVAADTGRNGWRGLWRPVLMIAGLVFAGFVLSRVPVENLRTSASAWSFVVLGAAACAAGLPRQAVAFAAGYAFGFWSGCGLALTACMFGCAANFVWARSIARAWVQRRLRGRLARLNRFLAAHPFTSTLTLRLLPVGNNLILNLVAGISGVAALPFFAASAAGYLPQTIIFVLLGSGTQVRQSAQITVGIVLFVLSFAVGALMMHRIRVGRDPLSGAPRS